MSHLTVVGHFPAWLLAGWIAWLLWAGAQVVWYRRLRADPIPITAPSPAEQPAAPEVERPSVTLRAPGPALRSMTPAAVKRAAAPPDESVPEAPTGNTPADAAASDAADDDITPS